MAIYLYTGEGAGKTTNALGLALRSLGHGHKVLIVQFLKWWENTGEYKFQKQNENYKIYQFGRKGWHGLKNLTEKDKELTKKGFEFALEKAKKEKVHLLILDELNLAVAWNLIDCNYVTKKIKSYQKKNPKTDIVLTGRYAPKALIEFSDCANEISVVKVPKKFINKKGISY